MDIPFPFWIIYNILFLPKYIWNYNSRFEAVEVISEWNNVQFLI